MNRGCGGFDLYFERLTGSCIENKLKRKGGCKETDLKVLEILQVREDVGGGQYYWRKVAGWILDAF
jgi:hypothetical protein